MIFLGTFNIDKKKEPMFHINKNYEFDISHHVSRDNNLLKTFGSPLPGSSLRLLLCQKNFGILVFISS